MNKYKKLTKLIKTNIDEKMYEYTEWDRIQEEKMIRIKREKTLKKRKADGLNNFYTMMKLKKS